MSGAHARYSRREFLTAGLAAGGGLLIGFHVPPAPASTADEPSSFAPNAFVRVAPSGAIVVTLPYVEMGQGAYTAQAQLLAEELEVGIEQLTLLHAPPDERLYSHPVFGDQITGGSAGLRGAWEPLRRAGATTRTMLVAAAARRWRVAPTACIARNGEVLHEASGRRARFGELANAAARLPVPREVALKAPDEFRVIGKSVRRVDSPDKVNGRALFGIDAAPPGLKFAAVAVCPVFGGTVVSVDAPRARAVRGVTRVVVLDDTVAVVGDHYWAARKGLAQLNVRWSEPRGTPVDTAALIAECDADLAKPGVVASTRGDALAAEGAAAERYEAVFRLPMLPHLAMEPLNCTVDVREDSCEIWVGCQRLALARRLAAEVTGLPLERITVHNHLLGGGFGRRLEADYVARAVRVGREVGGPLKVIWSREEDVRNDYFRYHNHSLVRIGLDAQQRPVSFFHRLVGPAVMARWLPVFYKDGVDLDIVSVAAGPYDWPASRVEYVRREPPKGLNVGNWRGVGASRNAFVVESVIDDLAHRAGRDPLDFRRERLGKSPRMLAVMESAAKLAKWGEALPSGRGRGLAILDDFGSYVAVVADVSVEPSGRVRVERVVCVVDCGLAVNPDIVKAQLEGGIVYGLSAALYGRVTVANSRVEQGNFDDCPVVRMNEAPQIEVHLLPSAEAPGGVGEPGTAILFPAVTNAIRAATGKRLLELPIDPAMLRRT